MASPAADMETGTSEAPRACTVSELNRRIKELLEQTLQPFWLRGEIGTLTIHRSGHVYLTLKDAQSQIPAVFFRGAETARHLDLRMGAEVEVYGRLTVYEPRGVYQVVISLVRPVGAGDLLRRFEELRQKLAAEGLFDPERKRSIPLLPGCVGVVTSPQGAALRDFLQIVGRRFAGLHVRIVPVPVQGSTAAAQVAAAVRYLSDQRACDVIVVTRGGGSVEDLWAFNEEVVARAVAASRIPVISAVGHERDFTICDFAADLRVPTPSAAAELVIAAKVEIRDRLRRSRQALRQALLLHVARWRERVQRLAGHRVFHEPAAAVRVYQQRIDELAMRLPRALRQAAERGRGRYLQAAGKLQALDPHQVLARGYSILLDADGHAVRDAAATSPGGDLRGILHRGALRLKITAAIPATPAEGDSP